MRNGSPIEIVAKWIEPGVVMGIVIRLMCFAVLQGTPAIVAPSIQDTGFNASRMWDQVQDGVVHIRSQAVQFYENLRFVNYVAQRLREMEREPAGVGLRTKVVQVRKRSGERELVLAQHGRTLDGHGWE